MAGAPGLFLARGGNPILWSVQPFAEDTRALEVSAWSCSCPLSDDEWADLGQQAAEALGDFDAPPGPPERAIRRVEERGFPVE